MPPIAPSPQGSRAGLITSLVIFVILFVTATIFAMYYGTQWQAEIVKHTEDVKRLAPSVSMNDLADANVIAIAQDAQKLRAGSGIQLALQQRNSLAKIVTGVASGSVDAVSADTTRALDEVRKELKAANVSLTVSDDNLLGSLRTLAGQIVTLNSAVASAQAETKAANDKTTQAVNERQAALADKDKQITAAQADADAAKKAMADREGGITTNVTAIQTSADTSIKGAQAQTAAAQAELTKSQAENKKLIDQVRALEGSLHNYRLKTNRALMQPDGYVSRVPGNNTVFISLGEGQQISPGLTFEVYEKTKGLPPLTSITSNNPDDFPAGKASIEVIRILPGTSECRIIRKTPGTQIVEGDLILNLIYNAHPTKFAFAVYGDFDLAGTGQATTADADVMRRLITQWGGRVMDQVNPDTDFLVLGKEPVVSPMPESPTAIDDDRHAKQLQQLDKYQGILGSAIQLNIPILNQNRFLYFVGYYDQAKR